MALKVEDMRMVVIEEGGTFEAALDDVNETIDGMTKTAVFSRWYPREKWVKNSDILTITP